MINQEPERTRIMAVELCGDVWKRHIQFFVEFMFDGFGELRVSMDTRM